MYEDLGLSYDKFSESDKLLGSEIDASCGKNFDLGSCAYTEMHLSCLSD